MEKCPITELPIIERDNDSYRIVFGPESIKIRHGIRFEELLKSKLFIENKYLIAGAILNNQLFDIDEQHYTCFTLTFDNINEKISQIIYPKSPSDKLDNLFRKLYSLQTYDGEEIGISKFINNNTFAYKYFFRSKFECIHYIRALHSKDYINCKFDSDQIPTDFLVTFNGLNHYIELTEKGNLSNKCFVAIRFDQSMKETREAIKKVLLKNNYEPIIIDEQHTDTTQTLNDAIIAAIRSCKFCVADFTHQRNGVYFEAGFAAGLGKQVIYLCHNDDFENLHFDTNHFPHLKYESMNELMIKLNDKIKAWII
jgi:hypothetical protein